MYTPGSERCSDLEAILADLKKAVEAMNVQLVRALDFGNVKNTYMERRSSWSHNYLEPCNRDLAAEALKHDTAMQWTENEMQIEAEAVKPWWFKKQASAAALYGSFGKRNVSKFLT